MKKCINAPPIGKMHCPLVYGILMHVLGNIMVYPAYWGSNDEADPQNPREFITLKAMNFRDIGWVEYNNAEYSLFVRSEAINNVRDGAIVGTFALADPDGLIKFSELLSQYL